MYLLKIFLPISLITLSLSTAEAFSYQLFCNGNRGRVAVSVYTQEQRLFVHYSNSLGAVDFPLYEGVVTRATIPYVKIAEQELSSIDHEVLVSWPLPQCEFNQAEPLLMKCGGESLWHRPENSPLRTVTFNTAKVTEEGLDTTFETFKIRWGIAGENFHHFLALTFDPSRCQARAGN